MEWHEAIAAAEADAEKIARDGGKLTAEMAAHIAELLGEGKQQP